MTDGGEHADYMHAATCLLLRMGFQAGARGYRYLRDAVVEECKGSDYTSSMTKQLYPMLAQRYAVTDKQVERAIRSTVESAWNQHENEAWQEFFEIHGCVCEERPTNKQVIDTLTDMVKRSAAHERWR